MSLIPVSGDELEQVEEQQIAPEGEYDLVITNAQATDDNGNQLKSQRTGRPLIRVNIAFEGHDEYLPIRHTVALPDRNLDDDEKYQTMLRMFKRFLHLFDVPVGKEGVDVEDMIGATAKARVGIDTYTPTNEDGSSGEPVEQNVLRIPRIQE